jgi:hypothetical protein
MVGVHRTLLCIDRDVIEIDAQAISLCIAI